MISAKEVWEYIAEIAPNISIQSRIDEAKRAANHNNSDYTSDYLEARIAELQNQLKESK